MSEFIFVRHGESKANAEHKIAKPDVPLTALGVEQARQTAKKVKKLGINLIVCSPMLRAQQTAETIAGELGIDIAHIKIIKELQERRVGVLEGNKKTHNSEWYFKIDSEYGAEPQQTLLKRTKVCLNKIKSLVKSNGPVLVVGHVLSGFYLLQVASGKNNIDDFEPYSHIQNADFVRVKL